MFTHPFQFENSVRCSFMNPPGIVRFEIIDMAEIGVNEVKEMHNYSMRVSNGNKYGVLFLAGPMFNITQEARDLGDRPEFHTHIAAQAIIVQSISHRLFGSFIMRFKKHQTETRLFKGEKEAIKWLTKKLGTPIPANTQ